MKNHKLLAVVRHEFLTVVKQPSFWISMFIVPAIMAVIFAISYFSNVQNDVERKKNEDKSIVVVDQSGLINPAIAKAANLELSQTEDTHSLIEDVKTAKRDGVIIFPANVIQSKKYDVYVNAEDNRFGASMEISGLGDYLLRQSLLAPLGSAEKIEVALKGASSNTVTYEHGEETPGLTAYVVPGVFLILFYIALFMTIGYAMTSVSEEKENRAIEMVLSYVKPRTLITGKLIGTALVTLVQFAFYAASGAIAFLVALLLSVDITLPFQLKDLVVDPQAVFFGAAYLVTGFLLYVALMLATGSAFPSSKEANSFSAAFYLLAFVPIWGLQTLMTSPDSLFTQFVSYFPLTAPTTLLVRNTLGSLTLVESLVGLGVLVASTIFAVWLASRLFKLGALEFNSSIKLRSLFKG